MDTYKKQFKENIQLLIEQRLIREANDMVNEYEKIVKDDIEIYSIKGVIAIMEGNWDEAEATLMEGLNRDSENFDLLYNLAFLYQSTAQSDSAIKFYMKALHYAKNDKDKDAVYEMLQGLELKKDVKIGLQENGNSKCFQDCEIIIKNTDNKTLPSEGIDIYLSRKNVTEAIIDDTAPLISIYVLAYNNLEKYTRRCIECIVKYTQDINYELILVDSGSSDGTFEYFKSVPHFQKKIVRITKNMGSPYSSYQGVNLARGRYIIGVCSDVYVTKNWLTNMLKCAMSDERIGMVVPMADNVSNLQSPGWNYDDFEDMQKKAAEFNVSDPKKWHERLRLVNPIALYKKECLNMFGMADYGFFHDFSDDDIAFRIRRAGYKAILCKDVFVCHAGKITDKGADVSAQSLKKGRKDFKDKYYGIDAWDDVNNYEPIMMSFLSVKEKKQEYNLLGVDVLCGTPLLEAKNTLKEMGAFNTKLYSFTTQAKYWLDLSTICDYEVKCDRIEYLSEHFQVNNFDYIILGKHLNDYPSAYSVLNELLRLLTVNGSLLLKVRNNFNVRTFLYLLEQNKDIDEDISCISLDRLKNYLVGKGYYIEKISGKCYAVDDNAKKIILDNLTKVSNGNNVEQIFNKLMIRDYILKITSVA